MIFQALCERHWLESRANSRSPEGMAGEWRKQALSGHRVWRSAIGAALRGCAFLLGSPSAGMPCPIQRPVNDLRLVAVVRVVRLVR